MTGTAKIIFADDKEDEFDIDEDWSLEELQETVNGPIELLEIGSGNLMVVNEEGLMRNLPLNKLASTLAGRTIVGDVLVTPKWSIK